MTTTAPDPAESEDMLENYRLGTHQPKGGQRPVIVAFCTRPHREGGAWVGISARDLDGSQDDLTLAELVEQAEQHEAEQHTIEEPA